MPKSKSYFTDRHGIPISKKHFEDCKEALQDLYPNLDESHVKHIMKQGEWERRNLAYIYGGVSEAYVTEEEAKKIRKAKSVCGRV